MYKAQLNQVVYLINPVTVHLYINYINCIQMQCYRLNIVLII